MTVHRQAPPFCFALPVSLLLLLLTSGAATAAPVA